MISFSIQPSDNGELQQTKGIVVISLCPVYTFLETIDHACKAQLWPTPQSAGAEIHLTP